MPQRPNYHRSPPHKCSNCSDAFWTASALKKHQINYHRVKKYRVVKSGSASTKASKAAADRRWSGSPDFRNGYSAGFRSKTGKPTKGKSAQWLSGFRRGYKAAN